MKKLSILLMSALALSLTSCSDLADWVTVLDRLEDLEGRVETLEEKCSQTNTNIEALQTLVTAMQGQDSITSITPIKEGDDVVGYTISFTNAEPITIYNGTNGSNGADGNDGKDGYTPVIGVKLDGDNNYYWTLDGEYLLDDNGNKIRANGIDGKDGVTPFLKIENGYWYISFDEGLTWTKLGQTSNEGADSGNNSNGGTTDNGGSGYVPNIGVARFSDGILYWTVDGNWILDENGNKVKAEGKDGQDGENGADGITPELKIEEGYWYISYDGGNTWKQLGKATGEDGSSSGESLFTSVSWDENYAYFTLSDGTVLTIPLNKQSGDNDDNGNNGNDNDDNGDDNDGNDDGGNDDSDLVLPPSNQIWYTTNNNQVISAASSVWPTLISNTYEDGKGVLTFGIEINSIPKSAFNNKDALETITLPEGVLTIDSYAFFDASSLTTVNIPQSVVSIGSHAFSGATSLKEIVIPEGVIYIGERAFYGCYGLQTTIIPGSVADIDPSAFTYCTGKLIVNCNIPGATGNGSGAFYDADFAIVEFGNSVTKIGSYAFYDCDNLTVVDIPDNVISIGSNAFYNCSNIAKATIGSGVTEIGASAFGNTRLTVLYVKATTPPTITSTSISGATVIYVPTESVDAYKAASIWNTYASKIVGYNFE